MLTALPVHADTSVALYDGDKLSQAASVIGPWGGGSVADADDVSYAAGKRAIVVNINGPYQGGVFTPKNSVSLGDPKSDKTRYLQIGFSLAPAQPPPPPKAPRIRKDGLPDTIGSVPHRSRIRLAQFMDPGAGVPQPGGDNPGAPGTTVDVAPPPQMQFLHFILTLVDGSGIEYTRAIPPAVDGSTWVTMGVPLATLPWSDAQTGSILLKSVTVTADISGPLYVAFLRIASDTLPITASVAGDTEITINQAASFTSTVSAGSSNVTWTWDAHDGSPVEHNPSFTHAFAKPGKYNVTLTIADIDGLKKPVTVPYKVVVQSF
jgi:hypothetical protein